LGFGSKTRPEIGGRARKVKWILFPLICATIL
jgi:hypothetical protein